VGATIGDTHRGRHDLRARGLLFGHQISPLHCTNWQHPESPLLGYGRGSLACSCCGPHSGSCSSPCF